MNAVSWKPRYSNAAARVADSDAVIAVLRLAEQPDIISLAGGMPDPAVFRLDATREAMDRVLNDHAAEALNYSPTPGIRALRELLAERTARIERVPCDSENIFVTSGGVEGIRHALNALLNPGDPLLVEDPTYVATLQICRELGVEPVPVASDDDGMIPESLEEVCRRLEAEGRPARVLYAGPAFQNPTGRTWSLARRREVLAACERHDLAVLEDNAYAELRYEGEPVPSLKALAPDRVIFVHTFSKIFGPGLRLGWVVADPELIGRLSVLKLGTDQCSGALVQRLALAYGEAGGLEAQVEHSRALYRRKRDAMLDALDGFPVRAPILRPEGGFFLWLDVGGDTEALLRQTIERFRVAFVAGSCFFADPESAAAKTTLRLSFSHVAEELIPEAIRRLREATEACSS